MTLWLRRLPIAGANLVLVCALGAALWPAPEMSWLFGEAVRSTPAIWFPSTALLIVGLLVGRKWAVIVFAALFGLAAILGALSWAALAFEWISIAIFGGAVALARRPIGAGGHFDDPVFILKSMGLIAGAALANEIIRAGSAGWPGILHEENILRLHISWFLANVIAILTICPIVIATMLDWNRRQTEFRSGRRAARDGLLIAATILLTVAVTWLIATDWNDDPWYLYFVPMMVAGFGFGFRGATAVALAINVAIATMYSQKLLSEAPISLQLSMLCFASVAAVFGSVIATQRRGAEALTQMSANLDRIVAMRSAQLIDSEREARRALLMKERFISAASHDLRQPLAALALTVDSLLTRGKLSAADPQSADLKRAVDSMLDALENVLDLSRYEAGAIHPIESDFMIQPLFDAVIAQFLPRAEAKGLTLRSVPCDIWMRTDRDLLGRILSNLVDNAIRYTSAGGVTLSAHGGHGVVVIAIADSGPGITEEKLEVLRSPYQRGDDALSALGAGWGLGLAICDQFCRLLGGHLEAASTLGTGSVFSVHLPHVQHDPRPALAPPPASSDDAEMPAGLSINVLLIEDESAVAEAVKATLEDIGAGCRHAHSAAEALAICAVDAFAPDLILSDFVLRGSEDGLGAIRDLREMFGLHLPALLFTGVVSENLVRAANAESILVLRKPLRRDQLVRAFEESTFAL